MKNRNLLYAFVLSAITLATAIKADAQQDTVAPQNNTVMNHYTYTPVNYQRGSSTAEMRMFPNPARSVTTIYINSIQEKDKGDLIVYNNSGTAVLRNTIQPGNNDVNVSNLATGTYIVKVFTKDKAVYTKKLVVLN